MARRSPFRSRVPARHVRRLMQAWLAAAGVMLLVFAGVTAHAGWRAITGQREQAPVTRIVPPVQVGQAIPATVTPPLALAAPAAGVTGTIALPPMPVTGAAMLAATGPTVVAAPAFSLARASAVDRGRAVDCLTAAIYYEAASEPDGGQQAVAQVVLNRVRHPAFPHTVCGVVYQGSERRGCQFSFACDGAMARVPSSAGWARAARAAAMALAGRVYAPVGLATHYHTYAVTPAWNRSLVMTDMVGAHLFHRWKGWWGTPAAFRQAYVGGEPMPGPHVPLTVGPVGPVLPIVAGTPVLPVAVTPPASVRPAYADSGRTIGSAAAAPAATGDGPPADSGQVLDRWRDSGQPIR